MLLYDSQPLETTNEGVACLCGTACLVVGMSTHKHWCFLCSRACVCCCVALFLSILGCSRSFCIRLSYAIKFSFWAFSFGLCLLYIPFLILCFCGLLWWSPAGNVSCERRATFLPHTLASAPTCPFIYLSHFLVAFAFSFYALH